MAEIRRANGHRFHGALPLPDAGVAPAYRPRPEDLRFDLATRTDAVFFLKAEVPADAFTASTLGTEREGNGLLIDRDGLVLTIGYLVTEAERVTLADAAGKETPARVVGYDQESGFGLVRALGPLAAEPLPRGSARPLEVGDMTILAAFGGAKEALATTLVSKRPFAGYWEYLLDEALFTAPPHPRWSGAALLDRDGRLCGVGSLFVQDAEGGSDTKPGNMVVPIDLLDPILDDMIETGRSRTPPRPWLGMFTSEMEDLLIVAGLVQGGPADRGGVRIGDALLGIDGQRVSDLATFYRRLWSRGEPGTSVKLRVVREEQVLELQVKTGNRYERLKRPRGH